MEKNLNNLLGEHDISDITNLIFQKMSGIDKTMMAMVNKKNNFFKIETIKTIDISKQVSEIAKLIESIESDKDKPIEKEVIENLTKQLVYLIDNEINYSTFEHRKESYSDLLNAIAAKVDPATLKEIFISTIFASRNINTLRFFLNQSLVILSPKNEHSNTDNLTSFLNELFLISRENLELAATIFCEGLKATVKLSDAKQNKMVLFLQNNLTNCIARQGLIDKKASEAYSQKLNRIFSLSESEKNLLDKEHTKIQNLLYSKTSELIKFLDKHKAGLFLTALLVGCCLRIDVASDLYKDIIWKLKVFKIDKEEKLYSLMQQYMEKRINSFHAAKCDLTTYFGEKKNNYNSIDMLSVDKKISDQIEDALINQDKKTYNQIIKIINPLYDYWQANEKNKSSKRLKK